MADDNGLGKALACTLYLKPRGQIRSTRERVELEICHFCIYYYDLL